MKMTRQQLKSLVKECLLELLTEGLGNDVKNVSNEVRSHQPLARPQMQQKLQLQNKELMEAVKKEAGGNSIMEDILADTARTSLQTMLDSSAAALPLRGVEAVVDSATPEELFGAEASSKWANLAFAAPN
jgi:hypothetical protein